MLKHILTGQPSSAGSRHDFPAPNSVVAGGTLPSLHGSGSSSHHHHHQHLHSDGVQHQHFGNSSGRTLRSANDVYDSIVLQRQHQQQQQQQQLSPSSAGHMAPRHHPLNQSQLSVNNLGHHQRLNHSHAALNLSTLSTSKHSVNSSSPVVGPNNNNNNNSSSNNNNNNNVSQANNQSTLKINGGLDISRISRLPSQGGATPSPAPLMPMPVPMALNAGVLQEPANVSWCSSASRNAANKCGPESHGPSSSSSSSSAGVKEMLTSLGLLCLVSLLLALLSLTFLLKISPLTVTPSSLISPEEYAIVYQVTLALCALALSLNLCCLLVCAIQFLFAVKLVKTSYQGYRSNKYLQKSSISRVCAVGGFFISIPVFLTGMILYTFIQFHSTPAIVTSVFIGLGIVFCGCAMVHNVFVWQREKTNAIKALAREQCEAAMQIQRQQQLQQHQQQQLQLPSRTGLPLLVHQPKIGTHSTLAGSSSARNVQVQHQHQHPQHQHQHQHQQQQPQQQQLQHLPYQHQHHSHHHHQQQHPQHQHLHQQQQQQQQQHRQHAAMSPPLLLSSPSTHNHLNLSTTSHRNVATTTPPTTPGDRSPASPNSKLNRSSQQHQVASAREASGSVSPGLPTATLDLSSAATTNSPHELSTLV